MKRRLRYAMPRVHIDKLKEGLDDQESRDVETLEKQRSFIKAAATTLFKKVMRKRKPEANLEEEERNNDSIEDEEMHLDDTEFAEPGPTDGKWRGDGAIAQGMKRRDEDALATGKKTQHLNMDKHTMKQVKHAEVLLQKENPGKKIKLLAVVESDHNDENTAGDTHNVRENSDMNQFIVLADVHQVQSATKGKEISNKSQKSRLVSEKKNTASLRDTDEIIAEDELGHSGGARPKQRKPDEAFHEKKQKAKKKERTGHKRNKKHHGDHKEKKEKKAEVKWGLDESSESDGGWCCDEGDVPLLAR